jgi:hypothetical protein
LTRVDLEEEARFLFVSLFPKPVDSAIVEQYVAAHRRLFADRLTSPLVTRIVGQRLDAEAIEYALRRRKIGQDLTRKLQILMYLAEVRPAYYHDFVNTNTRRGGAIVSLAMSALMSGWKLVKGELLIRRHGLL